MTVIVSKLQKIIYIHLQTRILDVYEQTGTGAYLRQLAIDKFQIGSASCCLFGPQNYLKFNSESVNLVIF